MVDEVALKLKSMTIRLYQTDLDMLRAAYPRTGYNKVIRTLVHRHCRKLAEKQAEEMAEAETIMEEDDGGD